MPLSEDRDPYIVSSVVAVKGSMLLETFCLANNVVEHFTTLINKSIQWVVQECLATIFFQRRKRKRQALSQGESLPVAVCSPFCISSPRYCIRMLLLRKALIRVAASTFVARLGFPILPTRRSCLGTPRPPVVGKLMLCGFHRSFYALVD